MGDDETPLEELVRQWCMQGAPNHSRTTGNMRYDRRKLYSYGLKIAERFGENGRLALILPYGSSTQTTNSHISLATVTVHRSLGVRHAFNVPELDPHSTENIEYLQKAIDDLRERVLNKRVMYRNRVHACEWYNDAVRELQYYWESVINIPAGKAPTLHRPEAPANTLAEIIEEAGDLTFLGQVALEGHTHHLEGGE